MNFLTVKQEKRIIKYESAYLWIAGIIGYCVGFIVGFIFKGICK